MPDFDVRRSPGSWPLGAWAAAALAALFSPFAGALPVSANMKSQTSGVVGVLYEAPAGSGISPVGCTGMLVGAHTVLTAAHCGSPDGNPLTLPTVFLQDALSPSGLSPVAVSAAVANPSFNSVSLFGDLQVLTLTQAAPASLQTYAIYGAAVPARTLAATVGLASGTNGIQIDSTTSSDWMALGNGARGGDSGGPLLAEVGGVATLLGNVTFTVDTGAGGFFDGIPDLFGGTLFKDFIAFIQSATSDVISVITSGLAVPPPPPPPPPPPVQFVQVGAHAPLTVIGADDPACNPGEPSSPCPRVVTRSPAFQEAADGFVLFDFAYGTLDDPQFDPAGYFIDDHLFPFTDDTGPQSQQGFGLRIPILAGHSYGFYVQSNDQMLGRATLDVSNIRVFAAATDPQTVPAPGSLALAGLAMTAAWRVRRKVQATDTA